MKIPYLSRLTAIKEMKTEKIISGMYFHCHHDVLCEWVYDYQERVDYIKREKPKKEIKTRLRLFKKVKGKLPKKFVEAEKKCVEAEKKYVEAWKKYDEAKEKIDEAGKKYVEAREKCVEAKRKYAPEIEKFHKKECGCKEWKNGQINFLGGKK